MPNYFFIIHSLKGLIIANDMSHLRPVFTLVILLREVLFSTDRLSNVTRSCYDCMTLSEWIMGKTIPFNGNTNMYSNTARVRWILFRRKCLANLLVHGVYFNFTTNFLHVKRIFFVGISLISSTHGFMAIRSLAPSTPQTMHFSSPHKHTFSNVR